MSLRRLNCALLLCALCVNVVRAQAPAEAAGDEGGPDALREQSIYIPYEKLWRTFEKEGRGAFLPYEQFVELWEAARRTRVEKGADAPPVDVLISRFAAQVEVGEDVVRGEGVLGIDILSEGWHEIPLELPQTAILSATFKGEAARLIRNKAGAYRVLLEKRGEEPLSGDLSFRFAKAYEKSPGRNRITFRVPSAVLGRWDVSIPEEGVALDVKPLLAAGEVEATPGVTRRVVYVGSTPEVSFEWTPKAEGAKGMQALASVEAAQTVIVQEGAVQSRAVLVYDIRRTELDRLSIAVPSEYKVVNVFDTNVREWSVKTVEARQVVDVALFMPTRGRQKVVLELERLGDVSTVAAPLVECLNVGRQQGVMAIRFGGELRAEPLRRKSVLQIDAADLPADLRGPSWDFAYRYAGVPFELAFRVESVMPRLAVQTVSQVRIQPEQMTVDTYARCHVLRSGLFEFTLAVPADMDVERVAGARVAGAAPADVEGFDRLPPEGNVQLVRIKLARRATGAVGLHLTLKQTLSDPGLVTPGAEPATLALPIPRFVSDLIEREAGYVVVSSPESLSVTAESTEGVRPVALRQLPEAFRKLAGGASQTPDAVFSHERGTTRVMLSARRRPAHSTVRQVLACRLDGGVIKYEARFSYRIQYSGVKGLRIDIPAALAGQIRLTSPGLRFDAMAPQPADVAEGEAAWWVSRETELNGGGRFELAWEARMERLELGRKQALMVPRLSVKGVDRSWGQIVIARAESIDVMPRLPLQGLDAIDPRRELLPEADGELVALAYTFHGEWGLTLDVVRYQPEAVKATSIERGWVRVVRTRGDATSVQALYRLQSTRQRLPLRLPKNVTFDTQPVLLNGRAVPLEHGPGGDYYVPLTSQSSAERLLLEIRYVVDDGSNRFQGPIFPEDPAVQKVYLSVYVPREKVFLGQRGPWDAEFVWATSGIALVPRARMTDSQLQRWVSAGTSLGATELGAFATDGRHLLFSALRPADDPDAALSVVLWRGRVFHGTIMVLGLIMGLALVPAAARLRWLVSGGILVTWLLLGVFLPSLARALVTDGTVAAGAIVLVVWFLWYVAVTRPGRRRERSGPQNDKLPGPTVPPLPSPSPSLPVEPEADPGEGGGHDA